MRLKIPEVESDGAAIRVIFPGGADTPVWFDSVLEAAFRKPALAYPLQRALTEAQARLKAVRQHGAQTEAINRRVDVRLDKRAWETHDEFAAGARDHGCAVLAEPSAVWRLLHC